MVDEALTKLGINDDFEIIGDIPSIAKHGILNPPALMINGVVKISGRIPTVEEVIDAIQQD
ncbi:thioredoxin family protein [Anaerosolibacter sp.]|uniref:thioredoxin family protein n=1 Tax=Anaerosolibacter sp. TaxID=1872527 RepID=UPI0039F0E462